jgi:hypothetical protein
MTLNEFQENFVSHFAGGSQGNRNPLVDLKPMFLVMCYEDALVQMKGLESYFNDFVHILIIIRESGLMFDITEEKNKQVFNVF